MIDEIAFILLAAFLLGLSHCTRPVRAQCPLHWRHNGVGVVDSPLRARGEFSCEYYPYEETDKHPRLYPYRLSGRIWCNNDETPIQLSEDSVGCRRIR